MSLKSELKSLVDEIKQDGKTLTVSKVLYNICELKKSKKSKLSKTIKQSNIKNIHDKLSDLGTIEGKAYFTSENTSKDLARLVLKRHDSKSEILDFGSGTGQITRFLKGFGVGFERDEHYRKIAKEFYDVKAERANFYRDPKKKDIDRFKYAVGNPPFSSKTNKQFFGYLDKVTKNNCEFVMLLPKNYDKKLEKYGYEVINRYKVKEEFDNTKIKTKIFIFKKKN